MKLEGQDQQEIADPAIDSWLKGLDRENTRAKPQTTHSRLHEDERRPDSIISAASHPFTIIFELMLQNGWGELAFLQFNSNQTAIELI